MPLCMLDHPIAPSDCCMSGCQNIYEIVRAQKRINHHTPISRALGSSEQPNATTAKMSFSIHISLRKRQTMALQGYQGTEEDPR